LQKLSIDDMISPSKKTTHIHPPKYLILNYLEKRWLKR
jgi:hypothetical protein